MNTLPAHRTLDPIAAMPAAFSNVIGYPVFESAGERSSGDRSVRKLPLEAAARDASGQLRQHITSCRRSAGSLHHLHCFAELMYETVATRLVTTTALLLAGMLAINALV